MPLIVKEEETVYRLPSEGMVAAVCCDVQDRGEEQNTFNGKMQRRARIVWEVDEAHPDYGRPFEVSNIYVISLFSKANLRKMLANWRGRDFTEQELKGFDLEKLIGVPCQVQIQHRTSAKGRTFANVVAVVPLGRGMEPLTVSAGYRRAHERAGYVAPVSAVADDDDIKF